MSSEILAVLEYMEKEKGISREDMIATIESAVKAAAERGVNGSGDLRVEINPKTGTMKAWTQLLVVESVSDTATEIHIDKARLYAEEPQVGESVEREIDPAYLGRIAAKTAEQAIKQRLRQFEKEHIYDEFKDQVGNLVSGIVRRRERGDMIVEVGKAEAILPWRERVPGEDWVAGERVRCLLLKLEAQGRGPELVLSRSSMSFVRKLFDVEVTEIADGTVMLAAMAREPGYRTKVCVKSNDPKVDPVGACVGARGARVKSIVRELNGEKVDIVRWYEDPIELLAEALKPAVPKNVKLDRDKRRMYFEVEEDDLSIAIGRKGINARLTSRLLGWKLDIGKVEVKEVGFDERKAQAAQALTAVGVEFELADRLVAVGLVSPEAFEGVTSEDLMGLGFTSEEAATVLEKVASSDDEPSGDADETPDVAAEASEKTASDSDETKEGEETA
ncbi:MAG: transcription termination factor NusA [Opitutae bacterium]|jgi:N utilization substance protein A|nr:transcription termination factor NusA [Opitutae bacterium]MBT4666924.1 transcription termination factor NusA [Opitutae bacterium]MBT5909913.1 transcription termination factor NusA [Opitutae bacterium]MBT7741194.1 transcription termination factor NusA [Opitutae bacterium]MBT7923717.1 transcription termination factor NusA [Opitutae bacterium]